MSHSFSNLLVHLVFSVKNRQKDLTADVRAEIGPYLETIARNLSSAVLAAGGGLDHMHVLVRYPATMSVADLVRGLKANSSRRVRERFQPHFAWQAGYGAFSVSQSQVRDVVAYIEGQQQHHQRLDFQDEYVSLLKKNEIQFENDRLWSQGLRPGLEEGRP